MDELLKQKPDDKQMLGGRAFASIGMRQFDQAAADANHALSVDPNNAPAYLGRGSWTLPCASDPNRQDACR
jgi:Flp pilus assembly protein TadD